MGSGDRSSVDEPFDRGDQVLTLEKMSRGWLAA